MLGPMGDYLLNHSDDGTHVYQIRTGDDLIIIKLLHFLGLRTRTVVFTEAKPK